MEVRTAVVHQTKSGWHWRLVSRDGRQLARSPQKGYTRKDSAVSAVRRMFPEVSIHV